MAHIMVLDLVCSVGICLLVWSSGAELIHVLGGTVGFTLFIAVMYGFSYTQRKLQYEISVFAAIVAIIIFLNYVSFLELHDRIPYIVVLVSVLFLSALVLTMFALLGLRAFRLSCEKQGKKEVAAFRKVVRERLIVFPGLWVGTFSVITGLGILSVQEVEGASRISVTYGPLGVFWLGCSFVPVLLWLKKMKANLSMALNHQEVPQFPQLKKAFMVVFLLVVMIGSVLEISRGAWGLWISSLLSILIVVIALWRIWGFVLEQRSPSPAEQWRETASLSGDFGKFLVTIALYAVAGTIYGICLAIFLR